MEKKLGIYICTGCSIGDALDIEKLTALAGTQGAAVVKTHEFLCGDEGAKVIENDISAEGINTVVIAACSQRVNFDVFNFPDTIIERVNLREHVAWSHTPNDEDTQMLAEDYLRMGVAKAKRMELPEPHIEEDISRTVLVIGGGISGLTAALEVAKTGYDAVLVEKEAELGGFMNKMYKVVPRRYPFAKLEEPSIGAVISEVTGDPNIKVYTSSQVEKVAGQPGKFVVTIASPQGAVETTAGAVIMASGWKPYDANKLDKYGFGQFPNVITNVMMEEMAKNGPITRPSDGAPAKSVAFIQCAGQRDEEHLPYCSSVCCLGSLKQATYVREKDANAKAYIFYKDMRTPGQYELFYKSAQDDEGIFLTKGNVTSVGEGDGNSLIVEVEDTLLGEPVKVSVDLLVLATGMVPTTVDDPVLNLAYRQGPGLPDLELYNGFADSNFICFPYESRRTGVFPTGAVKMPLSGAESIEDATGAALKAIQVIEAVSVGKAVHPRSGDSTYPDFFLQRCTQCKRCTEECPFGTLDEDEKGTPLPNPNRCRRCGICLGACPERIINFKNYSIDILASAIKAINVPEEEENKPRVIAFVCENDAYPAFDMAGINRLQYSPNVRMIPVRCLGAVNTVWIADSLAAGIDGIMMIGCKYGDDYQCHYAKGSELANYRMEKVQETLNRLVLESDRVKILQLAIDDYDKLPSIIDEYMEQLDGFGPNPYKGF
ncbi:MAG: hydrogenase iron-sulfur subunit [Candidatus Aquicultor sp.]|nr:hydrogenase iron-sulfur subunit [Candidatus Aquicultor sp.]